MKNTTVYLLISGLLVAGLLFSNQNIINKTLDYKSHKEEYADKLNFKKRVLDPQEWMNQEDDSVHKQYVEEKLSLINSKAAEVNTYILISVSLLVAFLLLTYLWWRSTQNRKLLIGGIITAAIICLQVGLFAPMLEIGAVERDLEIGGIPINAKVMGFSVEIDLEQTFEGDLYFYYQSKSVMELIDILFEQRNWVVGISILMFSVLFPLGKLLLTAGMLWSDKILTSRPARYFVANAGKWSMADVFVVAVFLAFLAFNSMQVGVQMESNVLVGLYFFLGYCILSIISSMVMEKLVAEKLNY